ncbi:MAG: glycosyltransferase [Planctomycetota bacterium]
MSDASTIGLLVSLAALGITVALVPFSMRLASSLGMLDQPNARKVHRVPIPRLGGIAIFGGVVLTLPLAIVWLSLRPSADDGGASMELWVRLSSILVATTIVFAVGLVDDVRSVSSRFKLLALVAAAMMICGGGGVLHGLLLGGIQRYDFNAVSWLVTVGFVITIAVAMNFIDGLDGLAGGIAFVSSSVLAVLALASGSIEAALIPLALSGALAGFLWFNWHPAKTFMGDCGSMTIGFLLAASMVVANGKIGSVRGLLIPTLALSIPIADSILTVFRRRYLQRRSVFSAERGHIHHQLLDRGLTHHQAVIFLLGSTTVIVVIALFTLALDEWAKVGGLMLIAPVLYGTFRFAGSVRTNEMIDALKSKRHDDRIKRRYRASFEDLQLEFAQVNSFSAWWASVCKAAGELKFATLKLSLPGQDGRRREMTWTHEDSRILAMNGLKASLPIELGSDDEPNAIATISIASEVSLESASERLGLFSRLMTEYSLADLRAKQRRAAQRGSVSDSDDAVPSRRSLPAPDQSPFADLRVALVHDFYYTYCGAERVVEEILKVVPHAELFALFDFLPESEREFLHGKPVNISFIQRLPFAKRKHRAYLPLMPLAIEQLDLSQYDLVISSSYLAAKGVITGPDQLHVCYCHSPVRYAWDLQHQYLQDAGLGYSPKGLLARAILHYIRNWDVRTSLGVDHFVANSDFIARRIKKLYRRTATVIHPPVQTHKFSPKTPSRPRQRPDVGVDTVTREISVADLATANDDAPYIVLGRMVPYKRTPMIVAAFSQMPKRKLLVIGEGPDEERARAVAGPNTVFLGRLPQQQVIEHLRLAKALIFAAEEDFGIVPVEAMACGVPVIAYGKGGVTESVIDGLHGVHYDHQNEESLIDAVQRFESGLEFGKFKRDEIRKHAETFSTDAFARKLSEKLTTWCNIRWPDRASKRRAATNASSPASNHQTATKDPAAVSAGSAGAITSSPLSKSSLTQSSLSESSLPTSKDQ